MEPGLSLNVDGFTTSLDDIRTVGLDRLHTLTLSVGWPHRAKDWQFLLEVGQGVVALDEIGRVIGSAMWFAYGDSLATVGMVITVPRLQTNGTARWLMQHVLSGLSGRAVRLNATRAARRLYRSLDFQPDKPVFQYQGILRLGEDRSGPATDAVLVPLESKDLAAVIAADAVAFGVGRDALIGRLFAQSTGYGLFRDGTLDAFALCRPFGRGQVIGPVVAASDADAIAVVRPHLARHDGTFMRLDTALETGAFPGFLSRSGLPVFDTVLTMTLGTPPATAAHASAAAFRTYGLASHTLG